MSHTLTTKVMRKLLPLSDEEIQNGPSLEELNEEFGGRNRTTILLGSVTLFIFVLSIAGGFLLLWWLSTRRITALPAADLYVSPPVWIWLVPGCFLGVLFASAVRARLVRSVLAERHDRYRRWTRLRAGYDDRRGNITSATFLIAVIAAIAVPSYDWYWMLTPNSLVVDPFLSTIERRYHYENIDAIRSSRNVRSIVGEYSDRHPHFEVVLKNGETIRSTRGLFNGRGELRVELIGELARRSGVKVEIVSSVDH